MSNYFEPQEERMDLDKYLKKEEKKEETKTSFVINDEDDDEKININVIPPEDTEE